MKVITPDGLVIEGKPVTHRSGERFIKDPRSGGFWRLSDCTPYLSSTDQQPQKASQVSPILDPVVGDPGETSLAWDDPRLAHKHRLKGSGIPWAKPLSEGIPPWRWDGYWSEEDREDG